MNTFKRKALFVALAASLGVAGTAEAVYLNPNRTGQVLIFPYYTVQSASGNAWNTYLSVVNTTSRVKAVKVRFLEGKTSAEVLDFNLFLSPNDVWTGAVIPSASAGTPGSLITGDVSCTDPAIPAGGVDFRNYQYSTGGDALPGTGLDRTREGYVEMIEMGVLSGTPATNATHTGSPWQPANCAALRGVDLTPSMGPPQGGLEGTGTLINVNSGTDVGYKADALEAWSSAQKFTPAGFVTPNLGDSSPPVSVVVNAGLLDGTSNSSLITAYRSTFAAGAGGFPSAGAKAVASVYMHQSVINEYILDSGTNSFTDWVVTQPAKRLFVTSTTAAAPYTNLLTTSGACEEISFTFFDREERSATASGTDFSPLPPSAPPNSLCWESNVLSIRNGGSQMAGVPTTASTVLGSANVTNVNVTSTFQNGWGRLTFTGLNSSGAGLGSATTDRVSLGGLAVPTVTTAPVTFFGLPVTGFMVRTFQNGTLNCGTAKCQGNYSALFDHSYITNIVP